ncbi:hypothetical protein BOTBODRAFT_236737 [Botryobasidium botryosum FD-172 SS1]|uniref:Uncharacterized protein n=1 Tax=Botryobasidium botryosum (strain FD-172 SS1) TaxID=930990 RepID=A0A067MM51_BOTB1|nr:hypothetical protein BOTBODRAFT_236737 [Botryobasidium botryosum FD-172 SS1]
MTRLARAEGGPTGEEAIQALTPHILNLARSVDQVTAESIRMLQTELTAIHGTRPIPQHLANYVRTRMVPEFPISDEILVHLVREMHKIEFGTQVRSNPALRAMLQDAVNRGYAKSVAQAQAQALAQAQVQAQAPQAAAVSADGVVSDGGAGATQAALPTPGSSAVPAGEPLPPAAAQLQLQSQTLPQPPSQPIAAPIPPPEPLKQIYQTFSNVRLGDVD